MTTAYIAAEVFHPGEYLRDELDERGRAVAEFAGIAGLPVRIVSEILEARREITSDTALSLSAALGTSAGLWLNLQTAYNQRQQHPDIGHDDPGPLAHREAAHARVGTAQLDAPASAS